MATSSCALCGWLGAGDSREAPPLVGSLTASRLFIYPDQSYLGRMALVYDQHVEAIASLPRPVFQALCDDLLIAARLSAVLFPESRLNLAQLGNREPHLHWHLIPRRAGEPNEGAAPWPHPFLDIGRERAQELAVKAAETLHHLRQDAGSKS